ENGHIKNPAGQDQRKGVSPLTVRTVDSRSGPIRQVLRQAAPFELPALAVRLRRTGVSRHALARFRPAPLVARLRDLRQPRPKVRRRPAEPASARPSPRRTRPGRASLRQASPGRTSLLTIPSLDSARAHSLAEPQAIWFALWD